MKQYGAYLFDADGTIIDTTEMIYQCFLYTCNRFGGFEIDRAKVMRSVGLPLRRAMETYFGPLTDERFIEISKAHMVYQLSIYKDYLKPCRGALETLTALHARKARLAVVTSRRMETLKIYLQETGLWDFFELFVTPESTTEHKPHPAPALFALEKLGVKAVDTLFVGDAEFDVACGRDAGVDTALVPWAGVEARAFTPTYVLTGLEELVG